MPAIDVIIPCYNAEAYIGATIASVLAQTVLPARILVINDGSTDGSEALVKQIISTTQSPVEIVLISQPNGGLSHARNTGIRQSKAQYLAFLDADDTWYPTKLEKQLQVFAQSPYPKLGMVYCAYDIIDTNGVLTNEYQVSHIRTQIRGNVYNHMLHANYMIGSGSGVLALRACFDKAGLFDEQLRALEDWDMWLRISEHYEADYSPECLLSIRRHPSNMQKNVQHMLANQLSFYIKHRAEYQSPEHQNLWAYRFASAVVLYGFNKDLYSMVVQRIPAGELRSLARKTFGNFRLYVHLFQLKKLFEKKDDKKAV